MIVYLDLDQVLELHAEGIRNFGGSHGVRDMGLVDSAVAQPKAAFGGQELYPTLVDKAAAIGFSLVSNHAFVDGNKRIGFAAMDAFLRLNGQRIGASIDDSEKTILAVAAGSMTREQFTEWVGQNVAAL